MDTQFLVTGLLWYLVFLFSTTCHEAAHAVAAKWGGDSTAALGGQASLNPIPHMERSPVGTILVPLITFAWSSGGWMIGWASAPYDVRWQQRYPHRAAWMALAGPAANGLLALLAWSGLALGLSQGWFEIPVFDASESVNLATGIVVGASHQYSAVAALLSLMLFLNILLMVFNLFPVPPLDGSIAIGLLVSKARAARLFRWLNDSTVSILGLLMAWYVFGEVFWPFYGAVVRLLYGI